MKHHVSRCGWCTHDPVYIEYHDQEWGRPLHDDRRLFEFLVLEGAQAGLSWLTVLKKRQNYRRAFDHFNPSKIACYDQRKINELFSNPGIIRNRLKIKSVIENAKAFLQLQKEFGSFDRYVWAFVHHRPLKNGFENHRQLPSQTPLSVALSADLKKRGFQFVGPTIIYAFMQAVGMVNDHTRDCFLGRKLWPIKFC